MTKDLGVRLRLKKQETISIDCCYMGGKETAGKLKEIDSRVKAIVFSGYSNDPIMADPQKYGFCGVVTKPDKVEKMNKVLQEIVRGKNFK
ncbi:hypothetical protein KKH56_03965 [bacterium]|nr:hypothetical protein [bacterium]